MNIIVIGAGMSGLIAARTLHVMGHTVTVLDKGRGVGGRMATRRIDSAAFDHGAQFLTARSEWFIGLVDGWLREGAVEPWFMAEDGRSHVRYRGVPTMNGLAKHLAVGLDVRTSTTVRSLRRNGPTWHVVLDEQAELTCDVCLVTAPVPQALALVDPDELDIDQQQVHDLRALDYDPCFAVMCTTSTPVAFSEVGPLRPSASSSIALIADNMAKGVSQVPSITIHSTADFARRHLEDPQGALQIILDEAQQILRTEIVDPVIHRWRYAQPTTQYSAPFVVLNTAPMLVLAGDAFGGPRIEGAATSGFAAAHRVGTV